MFNPKGRMDPWSCSIFTSTSTRNVTLVHYGDDWSVTSVAISYNGKETSVTSSFTAPIPEDFLEGEARLLLTKEEREHGTHNLSKTVVADEDWSVAEALRQDTPLMWGAAALVLRNFAESELTRYTFEHGEWLSKLEEENAEAEEGANG